MSDWCFDSLITLLGFSRLLQSSYLFGPQLVEIELMILLVEAEF